MTTRPILAQALASAFLSGDWHWRVMLARGLAVLPQANENLRDAVFAVLDRWPSPPLHDAPSLERFLEEGLAERWPQWRRRRHPDRSPERVPPQMARWLPFTPSMGPRRWPVRPAATVVALAQWLDVDVEQLSWFADRRGLNRVAPPGPLHHSCAQWLVRPGRLPRLLEAPAPRLKSIQRMILRDVLEVIPPHETAHGFVKGRSVKTHATVHQGQRTVVRMDLDAFFTWVPTSRVVGVFLAAGYPREVATTLGALCTTRTPRYLLREAPVEAPLLPEFFFLRQRLAEWHLPQGAPTSPALANLVCRHLDARLAGLARRLGAEYSRYADDLVFSGAGLRLGELTAAVTALCRDEGFRVNQKKTRVMRTHHRQEVTGLVVNEGPRVPRDERDRLKATLHHLGVRGTPVPVELLAALGGRVAWVKQIQPSQGEKLERLLGRLRPARVAGVACIDR